MSTRTPKQIADLLRDKINYYGTYRTLTEPGATRIAFDFSLDDELIRRNINTVIASLPAEERALITERANEIVVGEYTLKGGTHDRARCNYGRFLMTALPRFAASNQGLFFRTAKQESRVLGNAKLEEEIRRVWRDSYDEALDLFQDKVDDQLISVDHFYIGESYKQFLVIYISLPPVERIGEAYATAIVISTKPVLIINPSPITQLTLRAVVSSSGVVSADFFHHSIQVPKGSRVYKRSWDSHSSNKGPSIPSFDTPEKLKEMVTSAIRKLPEVATPVIHAFGTYLGKGQEVIGREVESRLIAATLGMPTANMAIVVGEPGVGKTMVVERYAQEQKGVSVVMVTTPSFINSEWSVVDVLRRLFEEANSLGHVVVFIREIYPHLEMDSRLRLQMYHLLRARGGCSNLSLIIELTPLQRDKLGVSFPELTEYSQDISVGEPGSPEQLSIITQSIALMEKRFGLAIGAECAQVAIALSSRWQAHTRQPGKAIRLIEHALSEAQATAKPGKSITTNAEALEDVAHRVYGAKRGLNPLLKSMSTQSIRDALGARVFSQDAAIEKISRSITRARAGLNPPNKPIGVFMLAGSTGVGKTEIAKSLAQLYFGDENSLLRYDMSEFYDDHLVARLIGAPVGYVGHDQGGDLINKMMINPFRVILLDEFEKAHPKIQDVFLQVFDDARLTDLRGRVASFADSIIILTTNLGAGEAFKDDKKTTLGFEPAINRSNPRTTDTNHYVNSISNEMAKWLRPEFIARTEIVILHPLSEDTAKRIVNKLIDRTNAFLKSRKYSVAVNESVIERVVAEGFSRRKGARHLERTWETLVGQILSEKLVEKGYRPGTVFRFNTKSGTTIELAIEEPTLSSEDSLEKASPGEGFTA